MIARCNRLRKLTRPIACVFALAGFGTAGMAQDRNLDNYEYEPGEGIHKQEWYDPTDWFDANDGLDYEYDYSYDYYDDYDYDNDLDFNDYGDYSYNSRYEYPSSRTPYYPYNRSYDYWYDPYHVGSVMYWQSRNRDWRNDQDRRMARNSRNENWNRNRNRDASRRDSRVNVYGTIQKLDEVDVFDKTHQLAEIRTFSGNQMLVDLGPKNELSKLSLREGQDVTIQGRREMISAASIEANDRTVNIDRNWNQRQTRMQMISGTVDTLRTRKIDGDAKLVATIEKPNGSLQKVCLGEKEELRALNIEEGDKIQLRGHPARMDGKRYFVAKKVRVNPDSTERDEAEWRSTRVGNEKDRQNEEAQRRPGTTIYVGTVDNLRTRDINNRNRIVATVETTAGELQKVCLGTKGELNDMELEEGDQIEVHGAFQRIDGKRYFVASKVRKHNEETDRWTSRDLDVVQ
ncbi:MAG: hypothetical protein AB7N71_01340 [Phycisphaerae bacterium]